MFDEWQRMDGHAKLYLIEMIMALHGRSLKRARDYRTDLESMTLPEVRRELELIEDERDMEI